MFETISLNLVLVMKTDSKFMCKSLPFSSCQISMSVHWNPVLVTKMLIAPILTVLTAVHVNKDLLEMVQFVKVCHCKKLSTTS